MKPGNSATEQQKENKKDGAFEPVNGFSFAVLLIPTVAFHHLGTKNVLSFLEATLLCVQYLGICFSLEIGLQK